MFVLSFKTRSGRKVRYQFSTLIGARSFKRNAKVLHPDLKPTGIIRAVV